MTDIVLSNIRTRRPWWQRPWGIILILFLGIFSFGAFVFGGMVWRNVGKIKSGELKSIRTDVQKFSSGKSSIGAVAGSEAGELIRPESASIGNSDASLTIVVFGDYECPYTAEAMPELRPLVQAVDGRVRLVFRHFPITDVHEHAYRSALASECAREQNKFWQFSDMMFSNQQDLSDSALNVYAKQVGVNDQEFAKCMRQEKYRDVVTVGSEDGAARGVRGTPTFFINGHKLEGVVPMDAWKTIFEKVGVR